MNRAYQSLHGELLADLDRHLEGRRHPRGQSAALPVPTLDGVRSFVEKTVRAALEAYAKNLGGKPSEAVLSAVRSAVRDLAMQAADALIDGILGVKASA